MHKMDSCPRWGTVWGDAIVNCNVANFNAVRNSEFYSFFREIIPGSGWLIKCDKYAIKTTEKFSMWLIYQYLEN